MSLKPSKYNILTKVARTGDWVIVNPLSGSADLLSEAEAKRIRDGDPEDAPELAERGYFVDPTLEERRFKEAYLDFLDARESEEIQLFFVPTYACNFACSYCYQAAYENEARPLSDEVIDAFFAYVDKNFAGKDTYITLFGGEPLLPGKTYRAKLRRFALMAAERGIELAVVTNGFRLAEDLELFDDVRVREIQVTLDGVKEVHDARRPLGNGGGTFDSVVKGIDAALERKISVNLRVVVDGDNLENLPELADFAIAKGWTRDPLFKTQIGRNYELHSCQAASAKLLTRIELATELSRLIREHPQVLEFHEPAFSVARMLAREGRLPDPLFDGCPGCKSEWAFDAAGGVYPCTATVGKPDERVGTFFPTADLDEDAVAAWQDRDILAIEKCRDCPANLLCGGGCGSVAKNAAGNLLSPDCRPIPELIALGLDLYTSEKDDV